MIRKISLRLDLEASIEFSNACMALRGIIRVFFEKNGLMRAMPR
jgi:hypothetical protein